MMRDWALDSPQTGSASTTATDCREEAADAPAGLPCRSHPADPACRMGELALWLFNVVNSGNAVAVAAVAVAAGADGHGAVWHDRWGRVPLRAGMVLFLAAGANQYARCYGGFRYLRSAVLLLAAARHVWQHCWLLGFLPAFLKTL